MRGEWLLDESLDREVRVVEIGLELEIQELSEQSRVGFFAGIAGLTRVLVEGLQDA